MQFLPQIVVEHPSSLCSIGPRPLLVTGLIVQELQDLFSSPDRLDHKNLRKYLWQTTAERSKILVESMTRWTPTETSKRPAVLVRRNDWQTQRLGIGDKMLMQTDLDGWDHYSLVMCGSHTVFCLAREAGECETLGTEVYLQLLQFGPVLRERLDLLKFTVIEYGKMAPVLESREHFGIPITIAYAHNLSWTVRKHTPVLQTFEFDKFLP